MLNLNYVRKDTIVYSNEKYQHFIDSPITREMDHRLPLLKHFGIELIYSMESAWDAEAMYKIQTRQLYLTSMKMAQPMKEPYQKIGSVEPTQGKYAMRYEGLFERIPFTGKIVMGLPYIPLRCNIFDYEIVKVVNCVEGEVKTIDDLSTYIRDVKEQIRGIEEAYQHEKATRSRHAGKLQRMYSSKKQEVYDKLDYKLYGFHIN